MSLGRGFGSTYGPWAVVTGASSGIGEQFARLLGAEGLNLVIVARRTSHLERLSDELRHQSGVEVHPVTLDLGRTDFVDPLWRARLSSGSGAGRSTSPVC